VAGYVAFERLSLTTTKFHLHPIYFETFRNFQASLMMFAEVSFCVITSAARLILPLQAHYPEFRLERYRRLRY
jgi:hypothetical protein